MLTEKIRHYYDGANFSVKDDIYSNLVWRGPGEMPTYEELDALPWPPPPTSTQVRAERDRRMALGFDYDFGDARGIHTIATTNEDMASWSKLTMTSSAAIALGEPGKLFTIKTETGVTQVTALEWQSIVAALGATHQQLFGASFQLSAMSPIPADYTSDQYWP